MADVISPLKTVTFTITKVPKAPREHKTIVRLMKMQPDVRRDLRRLAKRRRQHDNIITRRGGRLWLNRARATKPVRVEPGETFTLTITPQIIPDIKSVQPYLKATAAS